VFGPYDDRVVLAQGRTDVNGPHQGAWVDAPDGSEWFVHFQDKAAYGRVVHLQPMQWKDGWPMMGEDPDGDGIGQPVGSWRLPASAGTPRSPVVPPTSDEFDGPALGLQWQWAANPDPAWWSLAGGALRLRAVPAAEPAATLWAAGHLLLQKLPAPAFSAATTLQPEELGEGSESGLVVMGRDNASLVVQRSEGRSRLVRRDCRKADEGGAELERASRPLPAGPVELQVEVAEGAVCRFAARGAGEASFTALGEAFTAREGAWIGAKVGLLARAPHRANAPGRATFDSFRVSSVTR
jgi:beta-xylosidase